MLTDNGRGMSETEMSKGISGLGYTDKGLETGHSHGVNAVTMGKIGGMGVIVSASWSYHAAVPR